LLRLGPGLDIRIGVDASGRALLHRPDLTLRQQSGPMVAVEVELTVKAPRRLRAICLAWARSRAVAGVMYFVSPPVRAPLERALDAVRAADRIAVVELSDPDRPLPVRAERSIPSAA
jgi:hypothetical protein